MKQYKPFEPLYKVAVSDCSKSELESVIRVTSAIIKGLNLKHLSLAEVQEVFTMPDHKAALSLGLTVKSQGIYHNHDLLGPHVWLGARAVGSTITATVHGMKALRQECQNTLNLIKNNN